MWKKITNYIKPFSQNQNPITFDSFDTYLDHIQKAISSQNLSDPKIITARATKKAIEKISTSMSIVITINPAYARKDHSKISNILCQFLIQSVEGDLRKTVWNNTITIITACDSVVDFQQWEAIIEAAFFLKYLRTTNDSKIGDILAGQVIMITDNINITSNPPKFNYWMNIISQFILPLFWGNNKCIDKKCQNSLVIPFLSFFNRNMAIPNSIPTLSSLHKNPLIPYYTMEILISAGQMLPAGEQVEFTELHGLLLRFLQYTFPIKISLNQDVSNIYPDIPKNSQFKDAITFLLNKQFQNNQNHSFTNQIINTTTSTSQSSSQNSSSITLSDLIIGNQLVDNGNRNMQLILTFFNSDLTKQAAAIIMQISRSTNIFPQIILILSTLFYRITEALFHSLIKKARLSTTTSTTTKTSKSRVPIQKTQQAQQRQKQQQSQQQYHKQKVNSQGPLGDFQQSNEANISDYSDLSLEQNSNLSTDNSSDTTASSSLQNFSLIDNSLPNEVFTRSPSTSSISSIDLNEPNTQFPSPQTSLSPLPGSSINQTSQITPKRHTTILKGSPSLYNPPHIPTPAPSSLNAQAPTNQIKTMIVTSITTTTSVTTALTPSLIQSYIEVFNHLLHLRPFFSACAKNIPPEKLGSILFGSIFTCNRFCTHQIACILFTIYFDAIRYNQESLRPYCENLYSLSHSFDLKNDMQEMFNLYASIFATICSHQLLEMNKNTDNSFATPLPPSEEAILSNPVYYAMKSNSLNFPKLPYLFFIFPLYYTNVVSEKNSTEMIDNTTNEGSDSSKQKKNKNSFTLDFTVPMSINMANNFASTFLNGIGKYNNYMHTSKFVDVLFSIYLMAKKYNCKCSSNYIYNKTCPTLFDYFLNNEKDKPKSTTTKDGKNTSSNKCSKSIMNTLSRLFENLIMKQYVEPELAMKWLNFFFEAIKIVSNCKSSYNDNEIALKALSTLMKCCCSPFLFRYSVIPFVNSHILMDYTSMYNQETVINNFMDKNSYINCVLRYFTSTIDISRQIKEIHVDSIANFPLSLQFFNEFVTDSQFRLTPYFYTAFFYAFQSQIANDDIKKLIPSTFSLLKKLISNLKNINDPECFLSLISVIPYHYEEVKTKCPELIPLFFKQSTNYSKSSQCSITSFKIIVRFVADLLNYLNVNDPLFEKSILFLLQRFESDETKNKICDEYFSNFLLKYLNDYQKKPTKSLTSSTDQSSISKQKQCAIIDNKSTIITFNFYSTYITVSNMYNTDNFTVKIMKKENLNEPNNNNTNSKNNNQRNPGRFKDHSLGSLVQNTNMNSALLADAFLSQKSEKQWLVFTPFGIELAESFNDRSFMEKHIIPIIYVKTKQRKVEDILGNKFDQTSSDFVSFLTSLGENVQAKDTHFIQSIERMISLLNILQQQQQQSKAQQQQQMQQQQQQQQHQQQHMQQLNHQQLQLQHQRSMSQVFFGLLQQPQSMNSTKQNQENQNQMIRKQTPNLPQPQQKPPLPQPQQQQQKVPFPQQQQQQKPPLPQPQQQQQKIPFPQQQQQQQQKVPFPQQQQQQKIPFPQQQQQQQQKVPFPQQQQQQKIPFPQQQQQQQQKVPFPQQQQQQQKIPFPQQQQQKTPFPQQQTKQSPPSPRPYSQLVQQQTVSKNLYIINLENIKKFLISADSTIYSSNSRHELLFVPYPGIQAKPSAPNQQQQAQTSSIIRSTVSIIWFESPYDVINNKILNSLFIILLRPVSGGMVLVNVRCNSMIVPNQRTSGSGGQKETSSTDDFMKLNFIPFGSTVPFLVPNSILGFVIRDLVIIIDNHINNVLRPSIQRPLSSNKANASQASSSGSGSNANSSSKKATAGSNQQSFIGPELSLSAYLHSETKIAYENAWSVLDQMEQLF